MRSRYVSTVVVLGFVAVGAFFSGPALGAEAKEKSLYERLGGYDAISAVVDDFAPKLFNDPVVGKRFFGMSDDSREGFRQKNKNLLCRATGGPCQVISRPADVTHGGLGIKASEFDIVVGHIIDTLNKFKVPEKEQEELNGHCRQSPARHRGSRGQVGRCAGLPSLDG